MANGIDYSYLYPSRPQTEADRGFDTTNIEEAIKTRGRGASVELQTGLPTGPAVVQTAPVQTGPVSQQPQVDLTKATVVEPVPGVGVIREGTPGQASVSGALFAPPGAGQDASVAAAPSAQDETIANLRRIQEQYLGMRAAPGIGMNKDIRQGLAGQQAALRGVVGTMEAQQPLMEEARTGMQGVGQQYITGLEKLGKERASLYGARREAMAADEARLAQAEQGFDASRVIRELGKSQLNSAALSFAAGLVGGLKGLAGDATPNQILGEVDKAVERDVMNQREQYQRMKDGMAARRTNFLDAVQMGADEQQALATTTLASMDQHKRALEFAQQRISNASDKAAVQKAISELDLQRGKMQLEIDTKNAANWVAMNKARLEGAANIEAMINKVRGMDPETRDKVFTQAHQITKDPNYAAGKTMVEAVGNVRDMMRAVPVDQQKQIWDRNIKNVLYEAANKIASKQGDEALAAVGDFIRTKLDQKGWTTDQRKLMALVQAMANTELKALSGGNVVNSEQLRYMLTQTWSTYDGFKSWMDDKQKQAIQSVSTARNLARAANPEVSAIVETDLVPGLGKLKLYDQLVQKEGVVKGQQ